jgi:hypothetical protein
MSFEPRYFFSLKVRSLRPNFQAKNSKISVHNQSELFSVLILVLRDYRVCVGNNVALRLLRHENISRPMNFTLI